MTRHKHRGSPPTTPFDFYSPMRRRAIIPHDLSTWVAAGSRQENIELKALVFEDQQLKFATAWPAPHPETGEALIRPLRMAVTRAALEMYSNRLDFHGVIGQDFVGVIEKVIGPGQKQWVGKRVVGSVVCPCGSCDMCRGGLPDHCRKSTVLGRLGRNGCLAELFTLPVRNLIEVPPTVDDDRAVFTHAVAGAYQILRQITVEGRPYVTVLGDGLMALLCAQVMSQINATVRCVWKDVQRLAVCEKWGVKHRPLQDVGMRADQNIVVDCTGLPEGIDWAMKMVRPRGKIVLKTPWAAPNANEPPHKPIDLSPLVTHEIQLVGSNYGPINEALLAIAASKIDVLSLISRRMKLSDGLELLRAACRKDVVTVLLEP